MVTKQNYATYEAIAQDSLTPKQRLLVSKARKTVEFVCGAPMLTPVRWLQYLDRVINKGRIMVNPDIVIDGIKMRDTPWVYVGVYHGEFGAHDFVISTWMSDPRRYEVRYGFVEYGEVLQQHWQCFPLTSPIFYNTIKRVVKVKVNVTRPVTTLFLCVSCLIWGLRGSVSALKPVFISAAL